MRSNDDGPDPGDSEAWRQVIEGKKLRPISSELIVTAAQQIGPRGDQRVVVPLMKEISDRMMRILRRRIGRNHRNEGWDMIEEAHSKLRKL